VPEAEPAESSVPQPVLTATPLPSASPPAYPHLHPEYEFADDGFGTGLAAGATPPAPPRRVRYELLVGGPLVAVLLAVILVMLLGSEPEGLEVTAPEPAPSEVAANEVVVELDEPIDLVDRVELNWSSSHMLDFAVVVAAEGEPKPEIDIVGRRNSMTIDVEPGRQYCFKIQATDSVRTYSSETQPLRGATCRE